MLWNPCAAGRHSTGKCGCFSHCISTCPTAAEITAQSEERRTCLAAFQSQYITQSHIFEEEENVAASEHMVWGGHVSSSMSQRDDTIILEIYAELLFSRKHLLISFPSGETEAAVPT